MRQEVSVNSNRGGTLCSDKYSDKAQWINIDLMQLMLDHQVRITSPSPQVDQGLQFRCTVLTWCDEGLVMLVPPWLFQNDPQEQHPVVEHQEKIALLQHLWSILPKASHSLPQGGDAGGRQVRAFPFLEKITTDQWVCYTIRQGYSTFAHTSFQWGCGN